MGLFDVFPHFDLGGFFLGEHDHFVFVIPPFHHYFDRIIHLSVYISILILEFMNVDLAFRFITDVHEDMIFIYRYNFTDDNFSFGKSFEAFFVDVHHVFHTLGVIHLLVGSLQFRVLALLLFLRNLGRIFIHDLFG